MSELIKRATKAINEPTSAAELSAVKVAVNGRRHEAAQRHADITEGGRERRQAVETGDVEQVQKMDTEARELSAELEVLGGLGSQVQARLTEALGREAATNMPKAYRGLADALEAEQAALRALEQARATTAGHLATLRQYRMHLAQLRNTTGTPIAAPAADPALLYRFLEVRGIAPVPGEGWHRNGHVVDDLADCLGLEAPRPSQRAVA